MKEDLAATLDRYGTTLERLDAGSILSLYDVMSPEIRFKDPFNSVIGISRVQVIFDKLFTDCTDVRFRVRDRIHGGTRGVLVWDMSFRPRRWPGRRAVDISGVSELSFDPVSGLAVQHIDHWDAGRFYEGLPLLGGVIRRIRRRLEIS